jgi:uncharacterized membrane protein
MSDGVRFYSAGPLSVFVIILIIVLVIIIVPLLILGIIGAAFTRLGFSWISALAVVLLILFGSFVNIPVYRFRRNMIRVSHNQAPVFGVSFPNTSGDVWETTISLNLGGAVIPVFISLYLMYRAILITGTSLIFTVCTGIIIVAVITYVSTRLDTYNGIQVPLLIPGTYSTACRFAPCRGTAYRAVTAFVSGITGVLLGGNLANLYRISDLEVPEVSFGGAGTFGSIFLCCMLPALIA